MASKIKPLNDELKKQFFPWVESKGFKKQKSTNSHFTEFRRQSSQGEDIFDIQWDKYWRPYFVINFKKKNTNDSRWVNGGRLQRKRGGDMSCWFSSSRPLLNKLVHFRWRYNASEVIEELKVTFEELEKWWDNGQVGPHMHVLGL